MAISFPEITRVLHFYLHDGVLNHPNVFISVLLEPYEAFSFTQHNLLQTSPNEDFMFFNTCTN